MSEDKSEIMTKEVCNIKHDFLEKELKKIDLKLDLIFEKVSPVASLKVRVEALEDSKKFFIGVAVISAISFIGTLAMIVFNVVKGG